MASGVMVMLLILTNCVPSASDFERQLVSILEPYTFSIAGWELKVIPAQIREVFGVRETVDDEARIVLEHFSRVEQEKTLKSALLAVKDSGNQGDSSALEADLRRVEGQKRVSDETISRIIGGQIRETLAEQGIFNPADSLGLRFTFPPVNFRLDKPPLVLVISPRDRIDSIKEVTLQQDVTPEQMKDIEAKVDALGVSSLVVETGGFGGTYPTFVINTADLRFTIDTAAHEWLHQYLAFKPLGFRYVLDRLGLSKSYEIVTMNETVAGIVGKEIGTLVYKKYYADRIKQERAPRTGGFDFNKEMREIRRAVDKLLAEGKIEEAESFMEQKRQYLASNEYHIRKLNQAYFAFHGSYGDSPTSISPIGVELRMLRSQSASLKDFLSTVAGMTSRKNLINSLK